MDLDEVIKQLEDPRIDCITFQNSELTAWLRELRDAREDNGWINWINVDDKLPATRKTVLIYDEYEGVSTGYYDSDYAKFRSIEDVYRSCNVTHWMPLPEPPVNL